MPHKSHSLLIGLGLLLLIGLVLGAVFLFSRRPSVPSAPTTNSQEVPQRNPKFSVTRLFVSSEEYFYVIEGSFIQKIEPDGNLSKATFLIEGEPTTAIMVYFPSDQSTIAFGKKNAKGEMVWKNASPAAIRTAVQPDTPVQLRVKVSTKTPPNESQSRMLEELLRAETIRPTYFVVQPEGIGLL